MYVDATKRCYCYVICMYIVLHLGFLLLQKVCMPKNTLGNLMYKRVSAEIAKLTRSAMH